MKRREFLRASLAWAAACVVPPLGSQLGEGVGGRRKRDVAYRAATEVVELAKDTWFYQIIPALPGVQPFIVHGLTEVD